jgi:hypothetical protein
MPRNQKKTAMKKEPVFIIRPVQKNLGLDYLHITLIVLVVALIALAFGISAFKPGPVGCQYGTINGTCATPVHNSTQALHAAEQIIASYGSINTSISLLPYYTLVNQSTVTYNPVQGQWYVSVPYIDPVSKSKTFRVSFSIYDTNLTLATPYTQMISPVTYTNNSVVGLGSVAIAPRAMCKTTAPIPVYLVTDPYSSGAFGAISQAVNTARTNSQINMSYYFVFGQPAISQYKGYGAGATQQLGQYLSCASYQPHFQGFAANVSSVFTGVPIPNATLENIAQASNINTTQLNSCLVNASQSLDFQAQLAALYSIQSGPSFVVNCKYDTIPYTLNYSIAYALGSLKSVH